MDSKAAGRAETFIVRGGGIEGRSMAAATTAKPV